LNKIGSNKHGSLYSKREASNLFPESLPETQSPLQPLIDGYVQSITQLTFRRHTKATLTLEQASDEKNVYSLLNL